MNAVMGLNTVLANLREAEAAIKEMAQTYQREAGRLEELQTQRAQKLAALEQENQTIERSKQIQALLTLVSNYARERLKKRLEETVTAGLQAVFNDDSEFVIDTDEYAGKPAAAWLVSCTRGGKKIFIDPEDGDGGGATDVDSLALRPALLELSLPKMGGPLILDEPGKMIDLETVPNLIPFIKEYLRRTGRQGLMVTHHVTLRDAADVGYAVGLNRERLSEVIRIV